MRLDEYVINQGGDYEDYIKLKNKLRKQAEYILENKIKKLHPVDTGIYYPVAEILSDITDENIKGFIIVELKKIGVEFYDNNKLYRF